MFQFTLFKCAINCLAYFSVYVTTSKCCIFLLFLLCVFSYFNIFVCIVFFHFLSLLIPYSLISAMFHFIKNKPQPVHTPRSVLTHVKLFNCFNQPVYD